MGGHDKDDSRAHRQLDKESLEFDNEEESGGVHAYTRRYKNTNLGIIKNKKGNYLKKSETPLHFVGLEAELLSTIYNDKENMVRMEI